MVFFPPCVHVPDGTTLCRMIINMKNTVSARAEITVAEYTRAGAGRGKGQKFQLWEKREVQLLAGGAAVVANYLMLAGEPGDTGKEGEGLGWTTLAVGRRLLPYIPPWGFGAFCLPAEPCTVSLWQWVHGGTAGLSMGCPLGSPSLGHEASSWWEVVSSSWQHGPEGHHPSLNWTGAVKSTEGTPAST